MTNSETRILVTGATGRIGRLVVEELCRDGASVRALTRKPEAANLPDDVETVSGDFARPATLDRALDGVDTVFLLWTVPASHAQAVVEKLAAAPHRHVVYLSAPIHTPHPFFQQPNPMRDTHAEVERSLTAAKLDLTFLRSGMFASNAAHWWGPQIRSGNTVRWPCADAETAPVDERDLGAVAARVLLDRKHVGRDYVVTGPESLTQKEQVRIIGDVIGRPIQFAELTPAEFLREAEGISPPGIAQMLLSAWQAAAGRPAFVTESIREILGVPPRTFRQWAADHAAMF